MGNVPFTLWLDSPLWIYWITFGVLLILLIPLLQSKSTLSDAFYSLFLRLDSINNGKNINVRNIECMVIFFYTNVSLMLFLLFCYNETRCLNFIFFFLILTGFVLIKGLVVWITSHILKIRHTAALCIKNYVLLLFFGSMISYINTIVYMNFNNFALFATLNISLMICYFLVLLVKLINLFGFKITSVVSVMVYMIVMELLPIFALYVLAKENKL